MIGRGRDAADVPIIMTFGRHNLEKFEVVTDELNGGACKAICPLGFRETVEPTLEPLAD